MVLALALHAIAQQVPSAPQLVVDLDARPRSSPSSSPREFCSVAGMSYFVANDGLGTPGLYRSFGTAATTSRVAAFPGAPIAGPRQLRALGSRLFFVADDPSAGAEPWISDGSAEGTQRIVDLTPGPAGTVVTGAFVVNGRVVCFGGPISGDNELFVTDGTAGGTLRLADIHPGPGASISPQMGAPAAVGRDAAGTEFLAFMAFDGSRAELWRSDGTSVGTQHIGWSLAPTDALATWETATMPDGRALLLLAGLDNGVFTHHLVVTDGTAAGTSVSSPEALRRAFVARGSQGVVFDGRVWFRHVDGLLATDGSAAGTQVLSGTPTFQAALLLGAARDALWFLIREASSSHLAKIDRSGTVTDFGSFPFQYQESPDLAGRLHAPLRDEFLVSASGTSPGLWLIDTALGSARPLATSVAQGTVANIGGRGWFAWSDLAFGTEPGVTDGTVLGTRLVADLATGSGASRTLDARPSQFAAHRRNAVFSATTSAGRVVVSSDGSELGTRVLSAGFELVPSLVVAGDRIYFAARQPSTGLELWHSDGSAAGTALVGELLPGSRSGVNGAISGFGDRVVFFGVDGNGDGLFIASPASITRLAGIPRPVSNSKIVQLGGRVIALAQRNDGSVDVVASDGDPAGTAVIAQLPGVSTIVRTVAVHRDRVWFCVVRIDRVVELHSTDGTAAGTRLVTALLTNLPNAGVALAAGEQRLFVLQSQAVFVMDDPAAGLRRVVLPAPILAVDPSQVPTVLRERLIFSAIGPASGRGVWSSDGTEAGTEALVSGLPIVSIGTEARAAGGHFALLRTIDAAGREELHVTDGRQSGTSSLARIAATLGTAGNEDAQSSVVVDGRFWFAADDPVAGIEPHVVELAAVGMPLGAACGGLGRAASLQVDRLPLLGSSVQLGLRAAQGDVAVLMLGFGDFAPQGLPAMPGCVLRVDPSQGVVFPALALSGGTANLALPIPALALLTNLELVTQAALGATDAPLGFDLSNAVVLRLGH
jgi:ELWxxDGT repeat protein